MRLRPYWIGVEGSYGIGVTAKDEKEALALAAHALGASDVKSIDPLSSMSELDQGHVIPNMGNWFKRGVWFPLGFD
ncbi:hypothetical protein [Sphingopyxis sp.]|uniref:hypothetical protein n=1 Tax=Sphingopyxis sp. TaxID=1908224 RepID=UPI003D0E892D